MNIIMLSLNLNFLTIKELSTERHFIVWAAKINQHIYFKGILISEYGSKNMLLCTSFVSTEDENLWIASRLIWFDGPRAPGNVAVSIPQKLLHPTTD